jgi:hypothetical protein
MSYMSRAFEVSSLASRITGIVNFLNPPLQVGSLQHDKCQPDAILQKINCKYIKAKNSFPHQKKLYFLGIENVKYTE